MANASVKLPISTAIDRTNSIIQKYKPEEIDWYTPGIAPATVTEGIVRDSFRKFVVPSKNGITARRRKAIDSFFADNSRLGVLQYPSFGELSDFVRNFIERAIGRDTLLDSDAWFGPGESFISSRGRTSAFQKLARSECYTVTKAALPHMFGVLVRNQQYRDYLRDQAVFDDSDCVESVVAGYIRAFCSRVEVVRGDRITTVPKDGTTDRSIGPQPLLNLPYQKQIGALLRRACKRVGNCLQTGQVRHKNLIKRCNVATVDLKGASNSNAWEVVQTHFPTWLVRHISNARVEETLDDDGVWRKLHMVSSMGNGFTFELMSIFLLAVCRFYDPHSSVYGDDIVCTLESYDDIVQALNRFGYIVNDRKSFNDGVTRESCGAFFVGNSRVARYDIKYCENIVDCIVMRNKIYRLAFFSSGLKLSTSLVRKLRKLNRKLTSVLIAAGVPQGPVMDGVDYFKVDFVDYPLVDQLLAVYLETHDVGSWYVPTTRREIDQNSTCVTNLQKVCWTVTTWSFFPKRRQLKNVPTREGHVAIMCSLMGSGAPDVGVRGAGSIIKTIVTLSASGIERVTYVHPEKKRRKPRKALEEGVAVL